MSITTRERFTVRRLDPPMRPKAAYEYYVTGMGAFPLDMLRYDNAWPASSEDAAKLDYMPGDTTRGARSVKLRSYSPPTIDRWWSFSWSVGPEAALK